MPTYRVYGFVLDSAYPLHGYTSSSGEPTVHIRQVDLDETHLPDGRKLVHPKDKSIRADGGDVALGYVYDLVNFWVHKGEMIGIDHDPTLDPDMIQALLQGVLMTILLRQRGFLTLHGAGLAHDGGAIAILGDAGWGKSTISSFLTENGYALLGDDIVAIDIPEKSPPVVVPGFPVARLRPDAAEHLAAGKDIANDLYGKKRLRFSDHDYQTSFPLRAIYVLEPRASTRTEVLPCTGKEALFHLIEHTRVQHLMVHPDYRAANLQQCKSVIDQVPVRVLRRKHGLEQLPEISETIEADLERMVKATKK